MKRYKLIIFFIIFVVIARNLFILAYDKGVQDGKSLSNKKKDNIDMASYNKGVICGKYLSNAKMDSTDDADMISRVDYPLIEFYPSDENEWLVIVQEGISKDESQFYIIKNADMMRMNSDKFKILTSAVGRGTTPDGCVFIYKDKKLIKEVPFFEVSYGDNLNKEKKHVSLEKVNLLIDGDLPSVI